MNTANDERQGAAKIEVVVAVTTAKQVSDDKWCPTRGDSGQDLSAAGD